MSIFSVKALIKENWGLRENDLDTLIKYEKIEDVSIRFIDQIQSVTEKLGSKSNIRIIKFDENAGGDAASKRYFKNLVMSKRDVFYYTFLSNKNTCIIFVTNDGIKNFFKIKSLY